MSAPNRAQLPPLPATPSLPVTPSPLHGGPPGSAQAPHRIAPWWSGPPRRLLQAAGDALARLRLGPSVFVAVGLGLAPGCEPSLALEVPWLEVEDDVLHLEDLDPLEPAVIGIRIWNRGTAEADVRLYTDGPIEPVSDRLRIAAGGGSHAGVRILPDGSGAPIEARVELTSGVQTVEVSVHATFD